MNLKKSFHRTILSFAALLISGSLAFGQHPGFWVLPWEQYVNAQTGTSYTYVTADITKLVTHSNAAAIAGTLPQCGSAGFPARSQFDVMNTGAGTLTITPTTSTIDGVSTLVLTTGSGAHVVCDGTNYNTWHGGGGSGGSSVSSPVGTLYTETGASCGTVTTCTYTGFTLAANALTATGAGSCMNVLAGFRNTTGNNNWTAALVIGGTTVTTTGGISLSAASTTQYATLFRMCNTGTRGAQVTKTVGPQSVNLLTNADVTSAIDFTASKTVNVVFTSVSAGDTIAREALLVWQE
jgi:hypothetical protein